MSKTVLILGGYGVFGGRLARLLIKEGRFDVIIAGRRLSKARAFCEAYGGRPVELDAGSPSFAEALTGLSPFIVIDAAGPFQAYSDDPYRVATAALAAGAHYLDLSDAAEFTAGVSALDRAAKGRQLTVLSGVSSVPALSSAAVHDLASGLTDLQLIESTILPGNRCPRGNSVVRSILRQVGRPLKVWRGGQWTEETAWADRRRIDLSVPGADPIRNRWASLIGAPDLALFPKAFGARSVVFRAGLELKLIHGGLALLSRLVRWRIMGSLEPLTPALKWMADRLERFGSDRGGMLVEVTGKHSAEGLVRRRWQMVVEAGDGPFIPAVPAFILCGKLLDGDVEVGARACLGEFDLGEAEQAMSELSVWTCRETAKVDVLFKAAIGDSAFDRLPQPVRDLHWLVDQRVWSGRASIERGRSMLSWISGSLAGFPPTGQDVPVKVWMRSRTVRGRGGEDWERSFGNHRFRSRLSRRQDGQAGVTERFGRMAFDIDLEASEAGLRYPVSKGRLMGFPLPRFLLPQSDTKEFVDEEGRVCFDVSISLPVAGHVVRYRGWLKPEEDQP